MILEGSHTVIQAMKEKKRLIDAGEPHDHIRLLCIQGGGLMRGAYGLGAAIALDEMGYTNVFTSLVGISSGAPIAAHFAAGTIRDAQALLHEDCCDKKFVNPWRFWNQVNTKHFIDVIRSDAHKKIDVEKVLKNPSKLYFGVAEYKTALPKILFPQNTENFFTYMHASINMQNLSPYKVIIDGIHYADGGFANPHIIGEAIKELDPTHVLIITNNDRVFTPISWLERLFNLTIFRLRLNGILAQAINTRREARDMAITKAIKSDIDVAVVWGDESIGGMENNGDKIASTVEASRTWWHGLFSQDKD